MADLHIPFSAAMVQALLEDRKTQTRRLLTANKLRIWTGGLDFGGKYVKPDAATFEAAINNARDFRLIEKTLAWVTDPAPHQVNAVMAQWQGKLSIAVGDRLYVREHWRTTSVLDDIAPRDIKATETKTVDYTPIHYEADGTRKDYHPLSDPPFGKHRRAMHMPRWASRLTLIVDGVKVERLQDISEEDALAEGVPADDDYAGSFEKEYCQRCGGSGVHGAFGAGYGVTEVDCAECETPKLRYRNLWNHINGPGAWEANPLVVAYEFRVIKANIDAVAA